MCTPWTMPRLVRLRVQDLASCFLACRFPLGDDDDNNNNEDDDKNCTGDETDRCAQVQVRNVVYDDQSDNGTNGNKKMSRPCKKCRKRKQLNKGLKQAKDGVPVEKRDDESCIQLVDEDFIVFCFGENDDLLKDDNDLQSEDLCNYNESHRSSKPVNCQKKRCNKQHIYCDHEDGMKRVTNSKCRHEGISEAKINNGANEDLIISETKEGDMLEIVCSGTQWQEKQQQQRTEGIAESRQIQMEEFENRGVASLGSRDSNQSDCSTGSFTFPVLGWELIGSPAPMPKSEGGQQQHHHKAHPARFQCCKF